MLNSSNNNWNLVENSFSIDNVMKYESLMAQGNGFMHIRGSHEDQLGNYDASREYWRMPTNVTAEEFAESECKFGFYIPGIYGVHPILGQELVNLPHFLRISFNVEGEELSLTQSNISNYSRILDIKSAVLTRSFAWHTRSGANVVFSFSRFLSASHPNLCMQKVSLSSDRDIDISVSSIIDADVRTNGYNHFSDLQLNTIRQDIAACTVVTDNDQIDISSKIISSSKQYSYEENGKRSIVSFKLHLVAGTVENIEKHTLVNVSSRKNDIGIDLLSGQFTYDSLLCIHTQQWAQWWNRSDVVIEGDSASQLSIRLSIYHLIRCKVIDPVSIDAKGYSGDAYFGRFFWDTEIFMLPFYMFSFPENARNLLDFRVNSLPGARMNAKEYGYSGAKYAWESSMNGIEQCACWQYADHEIHISADIVYAIDNFRKTVDNQYITKEVAQVIVDIARFYLSRLDFDDSQNKVHLLGVMGPDEYTPISDNNAYTNWMVKYTLKLAAQVGQIVGISEIEKANFIDAAVNLTIPRKNDDLVLQCDNFDELAEFDFDEFWPDREGAIARRVSQERIYRSKCLKQADVLMLMMLFSKHFSRKEIAAAWDYYLPFTTHDSSLSVAVHAKVALLLGKISLAMDFWKKSMAIDFDLSKDSCKEGVHIASYGMNWQLMVFGFGGIDEDSDDGVLRIDPVLPDSWTRLAFPIIWQGNDLYVDISKEKVIVENYGPKAIDLVCCGRVEELSSNSSLLFSFSKKDSEVIITELERETNDQRSNIRP